MAKQSMCVIGRVGWVNILYISYLVYKLCTRDFGSYRTCAKTSIILIQRD